MARPVNEDVSKLPVWAQNRIKNLEMHNQNLKDHVAELSGNHPGTNNRIDQHTVYPDVDLPANSRFLFFLGSGRDRWHDCIELYIPVDHPDHIEIRGTDSGLRIVPSSYNAIRLMLDELCMTHPLSVLRRHARKYAS